MHDLMPLSPAIADAEDILRSDDTAQSLPRSPFEGVRRILLPFDMSRASIGTLRAVGRMAEEIGAAIHVLQALRPFEPEGQESASIEVDQNIANATERALKRWVQRIVPVGVEAEVSIHMGETVGVIVACAAAARADLIVMTYCSAGGSTFGSHRSAVERVGRLAPCPVLTIPEKCRDEVAYAKNALQMGRSGVILIPVDFSRSAARAVQYAAKLASGAGARLVLAHGWSEEEKDRTVAQARVRAWAAGLIDSSVSQDAVIWLGGHSLYAILSEAIRTEARLIVLPTRAEPWARRLRAWSITDGVLRQASCPVISINENMAWA